ncbi:MAG: DUF721 domain-containing protein [Akkermansiaceae bacterium]
MAGSDSRSHPRKPRVSGAFKIRARLLAEWRGGLDPPAPDRNVHKPDEFLESLLGKLGIAEGIDEQRLQETWTLIAGEFVAQHTVPDSLKRGVLVLRVLQPAMKFHLQQMSGKLLANLRRELGKETVTKIVFKIG